MHVDIALIADIIIAYCDAITDRLGICVDDNLRGIAQPIDINGVFTGGKAIEIPVLRRTPERISAAVIPDELVRPDWIQQE